MSWLSDVRSRLADWRAPRSLGQRGERAAARYLRRKRYRIVAIGERLGKGEIVLIAVDGGTLVFIEVKTRQSHESGHPAESVDQHKQRQLTRLALTYLKRHDLLESPARFDVIAITWGADQRRPAIEHIQNAFEAVGKWQMHS